MNNLGMSVAKLGSVPAPRQKAGGLLYKRYGCLSQLLGVNKSSFENFDIPWNIKPHKIHRDSFCSTFKGIGLKKYDRRTFIMIELLPLRRENSFKTGSWNLFRFFFQNLQKAPPVLLIWESPSRTQSN